MGNIPPPPPRPATPSSTPQEATSGPPPPSTQQVMAPEQPKSQGEGENAQPDQDQDSNSWKKDGTIIRINASKDWTDKYQKFVKDPAPGYENTLVVVELGAPWCGPSRFIEPFIDKQAQVNKDVIFLRLDFDSTEEVAKELKVDVVPTFLLYKGGVLKNKIVGARRWDLSSDIQKFKNEKP